MLLNVGYAHEEPRLVSPHHIPKAERTVERCTGCAPGCKPSWAHGIQAAVTRSAVHTPQNAAFPHNLGHAAVPSQGNLGAFALWPIESPHPQKLRLTADNTWGALWRAPLVFPDQSQGPGPDLYGCTQPVSSQWHWSIPILNPRGSPNDQHFTPARQSQIPTAPGNSESALSCGQTRSHELLNLM